jgi:hypothetical protein
MGTHRRNRIVVRDRYVSRYHARMRLMNGIWQIEDLESANGTQLNREPITSPGQLRDGDRFKLGETWFRFTQEPITGPPMPYHLGLLTPREFEELIASLLQAEGFKTVKVIGRSGDGGIDVRADSDRPFVQGTYIVQCKRYDVRKRVPPSEVRAFHGVIAATPAAKGTFVTTSTFTKGARKFAEDVGMACIDGTQLVTLLIRHGLWPI